MASSEAPTQISLVPLLTQTHPSERSLVGHIDVSEDKGTGCRAWCPEFDSQNPHSGRGELTPKVSRSLPSTCVEHSVHACT